MLGDNLAANGQSQAGPASSMHSLKNFFQILLLEYSGYRYKKVEEKNRLWYHK